MAENENETWRHHIKRETLNLYFRNYLKLLAHVVLLSVEQFYDDTLPFDIVYNFTWSVPDRGITNRFFLTHDNDLLYIYWGMSSLTLETLKQHFLTPEFRDTFDRRGDAVRHIFEKAQSDSSYKVMAISCLKSYNVYGDPSRNVDDELTTSHPLDNANFNTTAFLERQIKHLKQTISDLRDNLDRANNQVLHLEDTQKSLLQDLNSAHQDILQKEHHIRDLIAQLHPVATDALESDHISDSDNDSVLASAHSSIRATPMSTGKLSSEDLKHLISIAKPQLDIRHKSPEECIQLWKKHVTPCFFPLSTNIDLTQPAFPRPARYPPTPPQSPTAYVPKIPGKRRSNMPKPIVIPDSAFVLHSAPSTPGLPTYADAPPPHVSVPSTTGQATDGKSPVPSILGFWQAPSMVFVTVLLASLLIHSISPPHCPPHAICENGRISACLPGFLLSRSFMSLSPACISDPLTHSRDEALYALGRIMVDTLRNTLGYGSPVVEVTVESWVQVAGRVSLRKSKVLGVPLSHVREIVMAKSELSEREFIAIWNIAVDIILNNICDDNFPFADSLTIHSHHPDHPISTYLTPIRPWSFSLRRFLTNILLPTVALFITFFFARRELERRNVLKQLASNVAVRVWNYLRLRNEPFSQAQIREDLIATLPDDEPSLLPPCVLRSGMVYVGSSQKQMDEFWNLLSVMVLRNSNVRQEYILMEGKNLPGWKWVGTERNTYTNS
ncbi:hypothetical protein HDU93_005765 [Gonapodya sp. JEL0774]|nr:hypothetical protein HDU93_005765 [Gonapodya sp. JEL0774]